MPQFDEIAYEQSPNFTSTGNSPYHAASVTAFRPQDQKPPNRNARQQYPA